MPLIGRASELSILEDLLEDTKRGHTTIAWLNGHAGIGKTAILRRFTNIASAQEIAVAKTQLAGPGIAENYQPVVDIVEQIMNRNDDEHPKSGGIKTALRENWADLASDALGIIPGMSLPAMGLKVYHILKKGQEAVAEENGQTEPPARKYRNNRVGLITDLLMSSSASAPLVVAFDDIQWADPGTTEVIIRTIRDIVDTGRNGMSRHRLMLILAYRPTDADTRVMDRITTTIDRYFKPQKGCKTINLKIPGIDLQDIPALAEVLLGQACNISPEFARWLQEQSEGNPLRLHNMLSLMVDRQLLTKDQGFLCLPGEFKKDGSPPEVLVRSLDALRQGELSTTTELISITDSLRRFLEAGAVFGRQFPLGPVSGLAGLNKSEEIDTLRDALRRGFIAESEIDTGKALIPAGVFASESHIRALVAQMPRSVYSSHHLAAAHWWENQLVEVYSVLENLYDGRMVDNLFNVQRNVSLSRVTNWVANISHHYMASGQMLDALRAAVTCVSRLRESFSIHNPGDKFEETNRVDRAAVHAGFRLINQLEQDRSAYLNNVSWPETRQKVRELLISYDLHRADFYMDLQWYTMAESALQEAESLAEDYGLDLFHGRSLIVKIRLAAYTRHIDDEKRYLADYLNHVKTAPLSAMEIRQFLKESVSVIDSPSCLRILKSLKESTTDANLLSQLDTEIEEIAFEALLFENDNPDPWTEDGASFFISIIENSDAKRLATIAKFSDQNSEYYFEDIDGKGLMFEPGYLEDRIRLISVLDAIKTKAQIVGNDDVAEPIAEKIWDHIFAVSLQDAGEMLAELPPRSKKKSKTLLSAFPFSIEARRERAVADKKYEAALGLMRDPDLIPGEVAIKETLYDMKTDSHRNGYPSSLYMLLNRPDIGDLDVSEIVDKLEALISKPEIEESLVVTFREMLADYYQVTESLYEELKHRLARVEYYSQNGDEELKGNELERCMEISESSEDYQGALKAVEFGIRQRGKVSLPQEDMPIPDDPMAAESEAERAVFLGRICNDRDVSVAWFNAALRLYDNVPDGITRKDDIYELIAQTYRDSDSIPADGDTEQAVDQENESIRQGMISALEEAIDLNRVIGDVSRVQELRLSLADAYLENGDLERTRELYLQQLKEDLERGDFDYAETADLGSLVVKTDFLREESSEENEEREDTDTPGLASQDKLNALLQLKNEMSLIIREAKAKVEGYSIREPNAVDASAK